MFEILIPVIVQLNGLKMLFVQVILFRNYIIIALEKLKDRYPMCLVHSQER